jgi:hypothetical protein
MRLTLRNRSAAAQTFTLASRTPGVSIAESSAALTVPAGGSATQPLHLIAERGGFRGGQRAAVIAITADGTHTQAVACQLFGPGGSP